MPRIDNHIAATSERKTFEQNVFDTVLLCASKIKKLSLGLEFCIFLARLSCLSQLLKSPLMARITNITQNMILSGNYVIDTARAVDGIFKGHLSVAPSEETTSEQTESSEVIDGETDPLPSSPRAPHGNSAYEPSTVEEIRTSKERRSSAITQLRARIQANGPKIKVALAQERAKERLPHKMAKVFFSDLLVAE